jgi:hypothetical protein
MAPSLIHSEHRDNPTPIKGGEFQDWDLFKAPTTSHGAWVISTFPELRIEGPEITCGQALTIEDVVIYAHLDENRDPEYLLRFRVRNVGTSTIERVGFRNSVAV